MSASRFIDLLEKNQLLDAGLLATLRAKASQRDQRVTPESIAKALVEKGHLTKFQATKLIEQLQATAAPADDLLELVPDEPPAKPPASGKGSRVQPVEEVVILEVDQEVVADAPGLTPIEDAADGLTPVAARPAVPVRPARPAAPLSDLTGLEPLAEGIDDGLASTDPFSATATPATKAGKGAGATGKGAGAKANKGSRWDTKLMLGGFTALTLICILGYVLYVNLTTAPALQMWEAAMEDYRSESYSQAMAKFEEFLSVYPKDENASEARSRIALCQIRTVISDPQKGLERAKELLPGIESETAFGTVRPELGTLLIRIPQGFIQKAKLATDMAQKETLASLAETGMNDLVRVPKYVPTSILLTIQKDVDDVTEDINRVRRDVNQDRELRTTITKIDELLGKEDTLAAFASYKQLTATYPGLERDADLLAAVLRITDRERGLAKVVEEPIAVQTGPDPNATPQTRIVLATRQGAAAPNVTDRTAVIQVGGSVYGIDVGTGKVLWDRFVGFPAPAAPVAISSQAEADRLIVERDQLLRLAIRTGQPVWQLPLGAAGLTPVVAGDRLYVATRAGRILEVDANSGASARQITIPQTLHAGAAIADDRPYLFQTGEHSNLYVFSTSSLACEDVYYLGHKAGTIHVPPLALLGHLFVAENAGQDFCLLHVLSIRSEEGEQKVLRKAQDPIRLTGNVVLPLVVYGNRVLVVTDRADVRVLNINVNAKENPVSEAAAKPASPDAPLTVYPLAEAGTLWLADDRLTRFRIQVTTKEVNLVENVNRGDAFVAPLQLFNDLLIFARRARDSVGTTISAVNIDQPRKAIWSTDVGVPAGRVTVSPANQIQVISAAGSLFEIDRQAVQNKYQDQPKQTVRSPQGAWSFTDAIELPGGLVAFFNPPDPTQLLVYNPAQANTPLQLVNAAIQNAKVTCTPIAFQGGLLTPLDSGSILMLDPLTGKDKLLPFQPALEPGETVRWQRPAVIGEKQDAVLIVNDRRELYRIGVKDQPQPFLAELAKAKLDFEIASPLAAIGNTCYAVSRNSGGDALVALDVNDLKAAQEFDLGGQRVTWGPWSSPEGVLIVTDGKQLHCYDANRQAKWSKPAVAHGHPAGVPLLDQGDFLFTSVDGTIWRVAAATGEERARAALQEPLGAGPVLFNGRLLLCGSDGTLHVVPLPAPAAG